MQELDTRDKIFIILLVTQDFFRVNKIINNKIKARPKP